MIDDGSSVQWRTVVGFEGIYAISNQGEILRVDGNPRSLIRNPDGKPLRGHTDKNGYRNVMLYRGFGGEIFWRHRLVLEAFSGPAPEAHECAHVDGNPSNCCLSNLEWVTKPVNASHKIRHGTHNRGENHPLARLSEEDVHEIDRLRTAGFTYAKIAVQFGLSASVARSIFLRKKWRHVPKLVEVFK